MDEELATSLHMDTRRVDAHRSRLNGDMLASVASVLQREQSDTLTDEVMDALVAVARVAHLPMFAKHVAAFETGLATSDVRRTFLNLKTAIILFHNGWPGHNDVATEAEVRAWVCS